MVTPLKPDDNAELEQVQQKLTGFCVQTLHENKRSEERFHDSVASGSALACKAISWQDGDMPYSEEYGDFYYSRADGRAECRHVFLAGNGLPERFATGAKFVIGELGFGTGLNFLETWAAFERIAPAGSMLEFHSFEVQLLHRDEMLRALSCWPDLGDRTSRLLDIWPDKPGGDILVEFECGATRLILHIHAGLALKQLSSADFMANAWYLDGFSPAKNPEMWSAELLRLVSHHTADLGTCATYSAAGWVRRNLQSAGFNVEKRPGHAGKRDMSVGVLAAK